MEVDGAMWLLQWLGASYEAFLRTPGTIAAPALRGPEPPGRRTAAGRTALDRLPPVRHHGAPRSPGRRARQARPDLEASRGRDSQPAGHHRDADRVRERRTHRPFEARACACLVGQAGGGVPYPSSDRERSRGRRSPALTGAGYGAYVPSTSSA